MVESTSPKKRRVIAPPVTERPKIKVAVEESRLQTPPMPPFPNSPLKIEINTDKQYSRVEEIDPSLAEVLLEANVRNRPISQAHVASLARDMLAGKWRLTHQGIALDKDGRLVDGQHRLSAIVESKTTQKMVVTYNVQPDAFHSIDVGIQPRSVAQIASLIRGTKNSTMVTAGAKILWFMLEDNRDKPIRNKWTESEVFELLDLFEHDLSWAAERVGRSRQLRMASVVAAIAYAAPVARDEVQDFVTRMATRLDNTKTMASCWRALERIGIAGNHEQRMDMVLVVLKAIMHHLKGEHDLGSISARTRDTHLNQPVFTFFRHRRKKHGLPV